MENPYEMDSINVVKLYKTYIWAESWLCSRAYTFIDFPPTWLNLFAEAIKLNPISLNEFTNYMYLIII